MVFQHYTDFVDAGRLFLVALAQCALVDGTGVERGLPLRGGSAGC